MRWIVRKTRRIFSARKRLCWSLETPASRPNSRPHSGPRVDSGASLISRSVATAKNMYAGPFPRDNFPYQLRRGKPIKRAGSDLLQNYFVTELSREFYRAQRTPTAHFNLSIGHAILIIYEGRSSMRPVAVVGIGKT